MWTSRVTTQIPLLKIWPKEFKKRLSDISSNEELFNQEAPIYQEALNKCGYSFNLKFNPERSNPENATKRQRKRKMIWFNPPFAMNVKTPIGRKFIQLVKDTFKKSNPLSKIFNKNTLKVSYKTTPNMKQIITSHNVSKIKEEVKEKVEEKLCSCPKSKKEACPLKGECLKDCIIYQATVTHTNTGHKETYIGMTQNSFKKDWPTILSH